MSPSLLRTAPTLSCPALALLFVLTSATLATAAGDPNVTPGVSKVVAISSMGNFQPLAMVNDLDTQTGTLGPLSAALQQSGGTGGTLTHDLAGSAHFASARSGTVDLSYVRSDTKPFGTSVIFGGNVDFRYEFSVDTPTTVTIDYDVLGTESNPGNSWWAMQGFELEVNHQFHYVNFSHMFQLPPKPFSPQAFQGSVTRAIPAGFNYIQLRVVAGASGNQWDSVRTMPGRFGWRIGPPVEFENLGFALTGSHGPPQLVGSGSLIGGSPVSLQLSGALENTQATLVLGLDSLAAPFKGGVMVPTLDVFFFGLNVNSNGDFTLNTLWPLGLPAGFEVYMQMWLADPAGPSGFAASNGVRALVP